MKFSILIPAYNEEYAISSCLNSLVSVAYGDKEIIVIDDASTDHTAQTVEKFLNNGVILVRRIKNGGRAAALNSGLQQATGDVVITTDADTIVPADWLQKFKVCFEQEGVVAAGGAYKAKNMDKSLPLATSILDDIMNVVFKKSLVPNKLSGVNSAILRTKLLDLGGFNEDSWWSEDSEIGWKLNKMGKVVYNPDNIVRTDYPDTWHGIWRRKLYWGFAMGLKFREQMQINIRLWLRPLVFLSLFVSLLSFVATLPCGIKVFLAPCVIFSLILFSMTIAYIPLGLVVTIRNKELISLKTVTLLAILPIVREFAYVYGMFMGFCKGKAGTITPTWKEKQTTETQRAQRKKTLISLL